MELNFGANIEDSTWSTSSVGITVAKKFAQNWGIQKQLCKIICEQIFRKILLAIGIPSYSNSLEVHYVAVIEQLGNAPIQSFIVLAYSLHNCHWEKFSISVIHCSILQQNEFSVIPLELPKVSKELPKFTAFVSRYIKNLFTGNVADGTQ